MNQENIKRAITKFLVVSTTLLFSMSCLAQTNIAVAPTKLNVLYIGVDNPVSVAASASSDEKVTVAISGCEGTVAKTATGNYNVRVTTVTDNCQLNVYVDGQLAGTSPFRVRSLPRPNATVGGFSSGTKVKANVFQTQPGISLYVKDFPFEVKYEVLRFKVVMVDEKNNPVTLDCEGGRFSPQVKQNIVQFAKSGDNIIIQSIMAIDPSGKEIKVPALVYTIE